VTLGLGKAVVEMGAVKVNRTVTMEDAARVTMHLNFYFLLLLLMDKQAHSHAQAATASF